MTAQKKHTLKKRFLESKDKIRLLILDFSKIIGRISFGIYVFFIVTMILGGIIVLGTSKYKTIDTAVLRVITSVDIEEFQEGLLDTWSEMRTNKMHLENDMGINTSEYYQRIENIITNSKNTNSDFEELKLMIESRRFLRDEFPEFNKIHSKKLDESLDSFLIFILKILFFTFFIYLILNILYLIMHIICARSMNEATEKMLLEIIVLKENGLNKIEIEKKTEKIKNDYEYETCPILDSKNLRLKISKFQRKIIQEKINELFVENSEIVEDN